MARKSRKHPQAEDNNANKSAVYPACVYARISNESSHAEDSIDNQIAICKEYINSDSELTCVGVYTDLGFSGTNFERPGYSDMMAGILCGDIKCVVAKDLSRIGRTYIEVGELLFDTFVQYRIRFISVNDHYDSFADDAGRKKLLILFKNLVNHMYSRDLSKKIKSAYDAKKQRGEAAGNAPYGYRKNTKDKCLSIDAEAAEIVKMIFDMRLQGESIHAITKYLNRNNISSPQHRRYQLGEISSELFSKRILWSEALVSRMLRNETYTGSLVQGKYECIGKKHELLPKEKWIVHENTHDAIISKEQFKVVSQLIKKSAVIYQHKKTNVLPENRYTSKIFCSRCGKAALRSDNSRGEPVLFYYSCRHCDNELKYNNNITKAPKLPMLKLDALVIATLCKYMDILLQFDDMPQILAESDSLREKREQITQTKAKCEKTIKDTEKTLSTAYTNYLSDLLDLQEYELVRTKIENDKKEAEAQLKAISIEQKKYYDIENTLKNQQLIKYQKLCRCESPTKEMIQSLIGRIYLTPLKNEVFIELNFEDCFEELRQVIKEGEVKANLSGQA